MSHYNYMYLIIYMILFDGFILLIQQVKEDVTRSF